jgi:hypothetical protein
VASRAAKAHRVYTPPSDAHRRSRREARTAVKADRVYTPPPAGESAGTRRARRKLTREQAIAAPQETPEAAAPAEPASPGEPEVVELAPEPEPARGTGSGAGGAIAGAVVGLFVWGFCINWLRGGSGQATGWLAAKFLNEPYAGGNQS